MRFIPKFLHSGIFDRKNSARYVGLFTFLLDFHPQLLKKLVMFVEILFKLTVCKFFSNNDQNLSSNSPFMGAKSVLHSVKTAKITAT